MKASDFIIFSDIDGTLMLRDGTVPQRNRDAIARFQSYGGRFAIATGRSSLWVKPFAERLGVVNAPCICFNGGMLCDFDSGDVLMAEALPDAAKAYTEHFIRAPFPVGLMVMTELDYHNVGLAPTLAPDLVEGFLRVRGHGYLEEEAWQNVAEPWFKLLVVINEDHQQQCRDYVKTLDAPGVYFTFSAPTLLEMLPERVNKGYALQYMIDRHGWRRERIACVGDYYNDLEMIREAGVGAATAEAPEEVKAVADFITGPYEDGAVADLIEHLEATYGI